MNRCLYLFCKKWKDKEAINVFFAYIWSNSMKAKRGLNVRTCGEAKKRLKNIIPDLENRQIFYYSRNNRQQMLALCCILDV